MYLLRKHKKWIFLRTLFVVVFGLFTSGNSVYAQKTAIPSLKDLAGKWQNAAHLLAMPAINNTHGAAEAERDILSIGNLSFPPITMTGGTGSLFIDGVKPLLTQTRWYPYQVLREGYARNIKIKTAVRMPYERSGLLFHIVLENEAEKEQTIRVAINLSANTSKHDHWSWGVPRPKEYQRFMAVKKGNNHALLLQDSERKLENCFSFKTDPDSLVLKQQFGSAVWNLTLKSREKLVINYVLVIGEKDESVYTKARDWAKHFSSFFDQVVEDWQERFNAMFTPNNKYFSGHLPILKTHDEKLSRMYYMSLVSILTQLRTSFPIADRVYVSNSPQSNCTMIYFWDTSEWAHILALLDPVMLKRYLKEWLAKGIYNGYAEEYLTGTLQGPWYSANDLSVFRLINAYLNVSGDCSFLSQRIKGKTVLEYMDNIATHWESLVRPGRVLADYGGKANLLECVPTYIHEVVSFNAANVWMMRRVAEIQESMGNKKRAGELNVEAKKLVKSVKSLYVPGQGVWNALHRDGSKVEIRHVFDFATVGLTIPNDLSADMKEEMVNFADHELLTNHWMRAQSLSDIAASVSDRPDHGPMGAYCAWPAETIAVFCKFNKFKLALNFLHHCTAVTYEGPFSQSKALMSKKHNAVTLISPAPQTYNASNGGAFAETILCELFGYKPDLLKSTILPDTHSRGFKGRMFNIWQNSSLYQINSFDHGLKESRIRKKNYPR